MRKFIWSFLEVLQTVAIAAAAVFLVRTFVAQPFLVSGASMETNFYNKDYLLVDELSYRFREPARGEVIVFKYPGDHKSFYIKRIIGLPGERVVVSDGQIVIYKGNEKLILKEGYLHQIMNSGHSETTLGKDQYFMMGDNRNFSFDSRSWGPVARGEIIGLVRFRVWPVNQAMAFGAPAY